MNPWYDPFIMVNNDSPVQIKSLKRAMNGFLNTGSVYN